jgi:hypothetical protein
MQPLTLNYDLILVMTARTRGTTNKQKLIVADKSIVNFRRNIREETL